MSRSIGTHLPPPLLALLDGERLEQKEGATFLLLSTTEEGWPHVAMLSVGELVVIESDRLRAALWPSSTATANLTARGHATIVFVHEGAASYVRVAATRLGDLAAGEGESLACFDLKISDVLEDVVPYAELTSGIEFRLADAAGSVDRWRQRVAAMRAAG